MLDVWLGYTPNQRHSPSGDTRRRGGVLDLVRKTPGQQALCRAGQTHDLPPVDVSMPMVAEQCPQADRLAGTPLASPAMLRSGCRIRWHLF